MSLTKSVARKVLGRELVFLPLVAGERERAALLPLYYTYRARKDGSVEYRFLQNAVDFRYSLFELAYSDCRPTEGRALVQAQIPTVRRGESLSVNLTESSMRIDGTALNATWHKGSGGRKFTARLSASMQGRECQRNCAHYLPSEGKKIGRDYYYGDDYADYTRQAETESGLQLVRSYCQGGRLLDVGCALGLYVRAFLDDGFDAYGVDISEFAIADAMRRVGADRVRQGNLDVDPMPFDGAFDIVWMWDVLEHSASPRQLLEKVTAQTTAGATLFLHTSNAESLTHRVLGSDWEGYSDYSHYGVDQISATSLAEWLNALGWSVVDWRCQNVWVGGTDPVLLRLRDAFARIPELAVFLAEHDLGDLITVVARRDSSAL